MTMIITLSRHKLRLWRVRVKQREREKERVESGEAVSPQPVEKL